MRMILYVINVQRFFLSYSLFRYKIKPLGFDRFTREYFVKNLLTNRILVIDLEPHFLELLIFYRIIRMFISQEGFSWGHCWIYPVILNFCRSFLRIVNPIGILPVLSV